MFPFEGLIYLLSLSPECFDVISIGLACTLFAETSFL